MLTAAFASSVVAVGLLYLAWRVRNRLLGVTAWLLMGVSMMLWISAAGLEFGATYGLLLPAIVVWIFVCFEATRLPDKHLSNENLSALHWNNVQIVGHAWHAIVVLPVFGISSVLLTVLISYSAPLEGSVQAVVAIFLLPVLWSLLAFLYLATPWKIQVLCGCVVVSTFSATALLR